MFRVLIVEDEKIYAQAIERVLNRSGINVTIAFDGGSGLELVKRSSYDVILLDNRLPDTLGLKLIPRFIALRKDVSVIMITAYGNVEDAVEAMREGAYDYVMKSTSIKPLVDKVLELKRRSEQRGNLPEGDRWSADSLLGQCEAIRMVKRQIEEVARSPSTTVLIMGESGTGKEVAARNLHLKTGHSKEKFIAVDCLSLPHSLAESHLFGHEKGAFTGADRSRVGFLELAKDGTVFLDEIGDIDISLQGKLLRTLETRLFRSVGGNNEIPLKARVVLATNRNLDRLVEEGKFRQDLYHRISVFPIHMPPLRQRGDDIMILAHYFVEFFSRRIGKEVKGFDDECERILLRYDYPGNIRELKNIIERAVIIVKGDKIYAEHLPERVISRIKQTVDKRKLDGRLEIEFTPGVDTMETVEKKMILKALALSGGNKSKAAEMLGISRFQLLRRLEKFGILKNNKFEK